MVAPHQILLENIKRGDILSLLLLSNIITCICTFIGFIYGILKFFKPKKAVYAQMITLSVGCMAFGRLYQVVRLLTIGDILEHFQLGVFGVIGSLLFLFSANYGVMDSLADDRDKKYTKYRVIPLIAPLTVIAIYVYFFMLTGYPLLVKAVSGVITVVTAAASYYNLKHLIFPDVDFGVINCLKEYNALALVFEMLCIAEMIANSRGSEIGALIIGVLMGIVLLVIVPTVERGIKKWTT
jgi:hypothetical protein